eukprot:139857-Amphidinium_carterae.1
MAWGIFDTIARSDHRPVRASYVIPSAGPKTHKGAGQLRRFLSQEHENLFLEKTADWLSKQKPDPALAPHLQYSAIVDAAAKLLKSTKPRRQ